MISAQTQSWQNEIMKYADDTVLIEKLYHKSDDGKLFECWISRNGVDCNYLKNKFTLFDKRSTKNSNIVFGDHEIFSCENYKYLGFVSTQKKQFSDTFRKKFSKLRNITAHCTN